MRARPVDAHDQDRFKSSRSRAQRSWADDRRTVGPVGGQVRTGSGSGGLSSGRRRHWSRKNLRRSCGLPFGSGRRLSESSMRFLMRPAGGAPGGPRCRALGEQRDPACQPAGPRAVDVLAAKAVNLGRRTSGRRSVRVLAPCASCGTVAIALTGFSAHRVSEPRWNTISGGRFRLFRPVQSRLDRARRRSGRARQGTRIHESLADTAVRVHAGCDRSPIAMSISPASPRMRWSYTANAMQAGADGGEKRRLAGRVSASDALAGYCDALRGCGNPACGSSRSPISARDAPRQRRERGPDRALRRARQHGREPHLQARSPRVPVGRGSPQLAKQDIVFAAFGGWDAAGAKSFGYPTVG